MKDKKEKQTNKTYESVPTGPDAPFGIKESAPQMKVEMNERLADADKSVLDLAKAKRETALEKAKTALAQSEVAELAYNNVILQLALRYRLIDGDVITEDGAIQRKSR